MKREKLEKLWIADQGDGTYTNPILYTDYSDPDVIRVENDYFMVASSFCNAPSVPLLHSKDLVNWKVINYISQELPFERYNNPMHGSGAWAPSIRFHEGIYYVFIPYPDEGILMSKTRNPWGEWSKLSYVKKASGWIDPCPFWDEDGKAYMVSAFARSRCGFKSIINMAPMHPDCSELIDDGQFIYDGHETQPTIEGPKLYKRNGYYYIFAPAGGVKPGWQTVLRSKKIYGPYEEKIVLHQGSSTVNGPHQGAWIDTPNGEDWFIHFQDVGNAGRILHLQPMKWINDWPVIGVNDIDGCGEPVLHYKKPTVEEKSEIFSPEESDYFEEDYLGLQWQWNANFSHTWYSLKGKGLELFSQNVEISRQLCDVSNLLTQKWPAPEFEIISKLDFSLLREGDVAGLVSLGGEYTGLMVKRENQTLILQQRSGTWLKGNEKIKNLSDEIWTEGYFKMIVEKEKDVKFAISKNGDDFIEVGETTEATPGRWVGVKVGLVIFNEDDNLGGSIKVDSFIFKKI